MSTVVLTTFLPARLELRDGSAVTLRAIAAGDEPALRMFLERVSEDSLRRRFFGTADPDRTAHALVHDCRGADFSLVAEDAGSGAIVGHAAWYRVGASRAAAAFLVADAWQGRGLGSGLLARLVQAADERGVATLVAETLPDNRAMIAVFERCGYPVAVTRDFQRVEIELVTTAPVFAQAA